MFKYVHKFNGNGDYENYMANNYEKPFVSLTYINGEPSAWTSYRIDYEPQPVDLSEVDINGLPTYTRETANCYVIHQTGWYEFPIVYGCAISGGTQHTYAYTRTPLSGGTYSASTTTYRNYKNVEITSPYIETDTGDNVASAEVVTIDASGYTLSNFEICEKQECKYVRFKVTEIPSLGGNAVVAIKNSSNVIMWSWHIWAYPFTLNDCLIPYTSAATETRYHSFLDVNLGWVKDASDSKYGTSPYYEWGRKDPMPRAPKYDNTVDGANSLVYGTYGTVASANTLADPIKQPDKYFMRGSTGKTGYGWISGATPSIPKYLNLWNWKFDGMWESDKPGKTVYDPCPPGYQVPQNSQYAAFVKSRVTGNYDHGVTLYDRYFPGLSTYTSGDGILYGIGNGNVWHVSCTSDDVNNTREIVFVASAATAQASTFAVATNRKSYKAAAKCVAPIRVE